MPASGGPESGLRQVGRVVHAVANHRHRIAALLQFVNYRDFVVGSGLRLPFFGPDRGGCRLGRGSGIAREQECAHPALAQIQAKLRGFRPNVIAPFASPIRNRPLSLTLGKLKHVPPFSDRR